MNGDWMGSTLSACRPAIWAVAVVSGARSFGVEPGAAPVRDAKPGVRETP